VSRRLRATYLSLLAVALAVFSVALAVAVAAGDTQRMFIDRQNDTARFAGLAATALQTGHTKALSAELTEYGRLFGSGAVVVSQDGAVQLAAGPGRTGAGDRYRAQIDAALSGSRSGPAGTVWPWQAGPMVVAEPVADGGEIIGVVLTVSPTDRLRDSIGLQWALLVGCAALVLLAGGLAATPLTRWLVRPLHELGEVTHAISQGRLGRRVGAATGPPELRRFAQSFNAMADQLAGLIERQRTFVSYASHQLRTPLSAVRLRVETLGDTLDGEAATDHALALEEVDRLTRIFDALLTFARAEATVDTEVIDAVEVVAGRIAAWQEVAGRAGAELTLAGIPVPPDGPETDDGPVSAGGSEADDGPETGGGLETGGGSEGVLVRVARGTLDQMLDSLIDNALKFGGAGGHVAVGIQAGDGGWVVIRVVDDGPGMAAERLREAARPFWREPTGRQVAGSGLGLTIVSTLAAAAGGRLELRAVVPHGLDARIVLVAEPADAAGSAAVDGRAS
jgi:signal transduction histidine kinase